MIRISIKINVCVYHWWQMIHYLPFCDPPPPPILLTQGKTEEFSMGVSSPI